MQHLTKVRSVSKEWLIKVRQQNIIVQTAIGGYVGIVYPGRHIRNNKDKSDTFTVGSVNADLRHYIPLLRRRSRCFTSKIEMLYAVVELLDKVQS